MKPKKATNKPQPVNNQPGFTLSENFLIDQLETKKKTKHVAKSTEEQGNKVGKMFKKKTPAADMEVDDGFEIVKEETPLTIKKSKLKKAEVAVADGDVPGFSAPKEAKKRKMEHDKTEAKKVKKTKKEVSEHKEVSKKELKIERKKKENSSRYDLSVKAKKVWEELRREDTPKDKQLSLGAELYGMTKGHLQEVCFIKYILFCLVQPNFSVFITFFIIYSVGLCPRHGPCYRMPV